MSPKQVLLVFANPAHEGINFEIFEATRQALLRTGHQVEVRDLYQLGFEPRLSIDDFKAFAKNAPLPDVAAEQRLLSWANVLIFVYPLWWYDRPAILKGWIDRVFSYGYAYGKGSDGVTRGFLKHQGALVLQTAGGAKQSYVDSQSLEVIERPMTDGTLKYCGISNAYCKTFFSTAGLSAKERSEIASEAAELAERFVSDPSLFTLT